MNELVRGHNNIDFKVNGRQFSFKMTYDADNACDNDLLSEFQSLGICEPEVICAMERIVREGDTVIDGGANIGFFSIYLAHLVGPKGKVIAIEPGQNNIWKLEENVRINGLKNIDIVCQPLWKNHDPVTLYMRTEGGRNSLFSGTSYGTATVRPVTLADLPEARLVKLDIEGSEVAALEHDDYPFIICEMNGEALEAMGTSQEELRARQAATFLLQKDGNLPMLVPPGTKIVSERQNVNILLSTIEDVADVWKEVRV